MTTTRRSRICCLRSSRVCSTLSATWATRTRPVSACSPTEPSLGASAAATISAATWVSGPAKPTRSCCIRVKVANAVKLLLDTHVWLRSAIEPKRLNEPTRSALLDSSKEIYVSAASIWEAAIKVELGKLQLPTSLVDFVKNQTGLGLRRFCRSTRITRSRLRSCRGIIQTTKGCAQLVRPPVLRNPRAPAAGGLPAMYRHCGTRSMQRSSLS